MGISKKAENSCNYALQIRMSKSGSNAGSPRHNQIDPSKLVDSGIIYISPYVHIDLLLFCYCFFI